MNQRKTLTLKKKPAPQEQTQSTNKANDNPSCQTEPKKAKPKKAKPPLLCDRTEPLTLEELQEHFFVFNKRCLLQINTHGDIYRRCKYPMVLICNFLAHYTKQEWYLELVAQKADRYDLDGKSVGNQAEMIAKLMANKERHKKAKTVRVLTPKEQELLAIYQSLGCYQTAPKIIRIAVSGTKEAFTDFCGQVERSTSPKMSYNRRMLQVAKDYFAGRGL